MKRSIRTPVNIKLQASSYTTIDIPLIKQTETNWCWATCAEMVTHYYGNTYTTQCQFANYLFNQNICCVNGSSTACDKPANIQQITQVYAHWGINSQTSNQVSFDAISRQISLGIPNEAGWLWNQGGGHVILIIGVNHDPSNQMVVINDPGNGRGAITYSQLQNAKGYGSWIVTWVNLTNLNSMINIKSLAKNDKEAISQELSITDLSFLKLGTDDIDLDLADSFEVWYANSGDLRNLKIPNKEIFKDSHQHHIHIFHNNQPKYFARFKKNESGKNGWILTQFFESILSLRIENKLQELATKNYEKKYDLRLLEIHSHLITAFWLSSNDDDIIIPVHYSDSYDLKNEYSLDEFRTMVIANIPPVGTIK